MFKKIGLSLVALIATYIAAMAISGNQIGFPIVGQGSYCGSFGNAGVCNSTIAAGPTIVTGNETIIANTNLGSGQNPQTVLLNMAAINALPYQYVASAANAGTTTLTNLVGALILDPATTLTSYNVVFPAATTLQDGQTVEISSTHTLTALTLTAGAGSTISNAPTALTISTTAAYGYKFLYDATTTVWYRVQ